MGVRIARSGEGTRWDRGINGEGSLEDCSGMTRISDYSGRLRPGEQVRQAEEVGSETCRDRITIFGFVDSRVPHDIGQHR